VNAKNVRLNILFALIALVIFFIITTAFSTRQILTQNNNAHSVKAQEITSEINRSLVEAKAFLLSLAHLHQFSSTLDLADLDLLLSTTESDKTAITRIGRFDRVSYSQLNQYLQSMQNTGIYSFKLKSLSNEIIDLERNSIKNSNNFSLPIASTFPYSVSSTSLLGIDLGTNQELSNLYLRAATFNEPQIGLKPQELKINGHLILLQPTYLGRYIPEEKNKLVSQSDGGFIANINVLSKLEKLLENTTLTASILVKSESQTLFSPTSVLLPSVNGSSIDPNSRGLTKYIKGYSRNEHIKSGNVEIILGFSTEDGLTHNELTAIYNQTAKNILKLLPFSFLLFLISHILIQEKNSKQLLIRARKRAFNVIQVIEDMVLTVDRDGIVKSSNPAAQRYLGPIVGSSVKTALTIDIDGESKLDWGQLNSGVHDRDIETHRQYPNCTLQLDNSKSVRVDVNTALLETNDNTKNEDYVVVLRDVSEVSELTNELEYRASHDSLTNIANRFKFEAELESAVDRSLRRNYEFSLCYLDLDQFKLVNDACGHSAGDKLLIQTANLLLSNVDKRDVLARLGGDEFGLLLLDKSLDESMQIAKNIHNLFQSFFYTHNGSIFAIRASIGFVHVAGEFESVEKVMAAADIACYAAKDRGRNDLSVYSMEEVDTQNRQGELKLLPKLQNALQLNGFRLYVQEIAGLSKELENSYKHYEILLRMIDEDGSVMTPYQLVLAAERYDLMKDVDRWVIAESLSKIAELNNTFGAFSDENTIFSINLSGQTAADSALTEYIDGQLQSSGVSATQICFEITETSAIANLHQATELIDFLHMRGCSVALDDFGSGVSSFGYLKHLPVDYLKIDGQFVKNIHKSPVDREMVKCMHAVAQIQGIKTVAEFVENEEISNILKELNVEFGQGYYYNKPFPIEDLSNAVEFLKAA